MVFKKITVIGSSSESWEDAAMDAVERAEATLHDIHWVEVESQGMEIARADDPEYQTEVTIAFELEDK
ncbi:MAG: dodecin [Halobacteria archaeon]|nr:dodecin [Halobacteria archaeon]